MNLLKRFSTDVECETILSDECDHFKRMLLTEDTFKNIENHSVFKMLQLKKQNEFESVFPNLTVVFRMYLSTALTNLLDIAILKLATT